ncbi:unnamed protein product [Acanthoscelides obtectus]|uniref:Uncharacterized protein n=1 Tax=Acanthoscelides obtectus TaxID=200917 RepID=A0A9P0LRM7_ACAOB|nr:unnamed protein product [Acanthoscelides obtectus]CAK1657363.1 hypothetical protein AOBTE_LOCUS20309 [Acanthoscelides obtectus]
MKIHLYLVLLSVATAWCEEMVCHEDYNFMRSWPSTKANSCNASHPHCIDTHEEIKRRCCGADATWDPEPVCSTVQYSFASSWRRQCPYGADPTSQFCIFFIRNTTYPFKCPYEEVLPFAEYVGITNRYNHLPTWVPAERNENQYGDGLYLYTEPSEMYGLALSNYTFEEPFGDKRCMIYHHTNGFEAVPCSTPHIGVCAYLALNYTTNSYCSRMFETCVSSDYPANSKCFCLSENLRDGQAELAEFLKPYQNYFRSLQRNCLIGLEQVDDEYIWISSKTKLNYTEWADDAIFGDSRKYGALTEKGWKLLRYKNETNCIIYQKDIHLEDCNLVLTYNSAKNQFFLEMSNPKAVVVSSNGTPLVFCFTDASSNELVKRLNLNGSNTFGPIHDGPGSYWCEAFVYPSVKVVKSNAVFLR